MSQHKKVVVIGATSGIGRPLAERFVENGSFVIVVGLGKNASLNFQLESIEAFTSNIMQTHPDVDAVIINAGIQRSADFTKPESVGMKVINDEFTTNYLSPVALTKAFLPYMTSTKTARSLIFTSSNLGLVPLPRCLNYCATKAALHHFLISLRVQLKDTAVRDIEILPPAVQTELHDSKNQPDLEVSPDFGMRLDGFTDETWQGLCSDADEIPVG